MRDIAKRLRASLRYGAMFGDDFEKEIFVNQIKEAIYKIEQLCETLTSLAIRSESVCVCDELREIEITEK